MIPGSAALAVTHLIGLALGVGPATGKLFLLLQCQADSTIAPTFLKASKPIRRQIVVGADPALYIEAAEVRRRYGPAK